VGDDLACRGGADHPPARAAGVLVPLVWPAFYLMGAAAIAAIPILLLAETNGGLA
jgi:hypothetical protein